MNPTEETQRTAYTLSSLPPLGAFMGLEAATLLTGIADDPDGGLRAYLGARYKGFYLLLTDEQDQENFRRAWGTGGHIWLSPIPPDDMIHCDKPAAVSS